MFNSVTTARRYRATLIPKTVPTTEAELRHSQGALPFLQFKAENTGKAYEIAHQLSGLPVLCVERIEVPA